MKCLFALPLLFAACALSAQETTVELSAPSKCLTVTVDVTIPDQAVGTVLSLKTQNQVFNLMVRSAGGQASCYYYDGNTLTQTDDSDAFALPAGRHTITLAYHADNDAATKGTRVWLDGSPVFNADKLRWANSDTGVTSITVGNDAKSGNTQMAGLTLHGAPILDEGSVPNPTPRLTSNDGTFSAPTVNLDGSVTIDATPITLTGVSANTFVVTLDAELPADANGTLIGWQVANGSTLYTGQAERNAIGEPLRHSGTSTLTTDPKVSPSSGRPNWTLTYDGRYDGARLYEDGELIAHAVGLKWSSNGTGHPATQITIGDSVSEQPGPFAGMEVYAAHVTMGSMTPPENAMTALYEVPEALAGLGEAALHHLITQNGGVGDFSVPTVTLNGETLGDADAARALWYFGKTGPFTKESPIDLT